MKLYSIYDSKADTYSTPMAALNEQTMKRDLVQHLSVEHPWRRFNQDFTLFEIGIFDEAAGKLIPHMAIRNIGLLASFMLDEPRNDGNPAIELDEVPDGAA